MHSLIRPQTYIGLRLPSGAIKLHCIVPNTTISIGKYGSFPANLLLGRPYNITYEIIDGGEGQSSQCLRMVPASEIHAEALAGDDGSSGDGEAAPRMIDGGGGVEYELVGEDGSVVMRTNRDTVDDSSRQKMTMDEIEALKKQGSGAGRDLINLLLQSHAGLDQKTAFSLAKYTLRKTNKYIRRFTVVPVDVSLLMHWLLNEKEPLKIMELREETLALIGSWANVHYGGSSELHVGGDDSDGVGQVGGGRWLMIDETGGLIVAAMAERLGILYAAEDDSDSDGDSDAAGDLNQAEVEVQPAANTHISPETTSLKIITADDQASAAAQHDRRSRSHAHPTAMSAKRNTLTVLHANSQPNLWLLKYFGHDSSQPSSSHPLYTQLKTLSWLQLLSPSEDPAWHEPEVVPDATIAGWKSGKRGGYFRKRRRWERIRAVVSETRAGGFDGLIVASTMDPATILQHAVPLLRGGAPVVVYSPYVEPLTELADLYSTPRRAAFANSLASPLAGGSTTNVCRPEDLTPSEDFPVNPSLLLAPTVQTVKARHWQCLPGRTHPLMTSRGGAEGYLFTATRVIPAAGGVTARGKFKRRKLVKEGGGDVDSVDTSTDKDVIAAADVERNAAAVGTTTSAADAARAVSLRVPEDLAMEAPADPAIETA
ncbi:MAG: hypothetical protein M1825_005562 [Sarcosagium campestre]|nr:MAG: hypothetical protein M1825_005562 [Sarcosagium campestre]